MNLEDMSDEQLLIMLNEFAGDTPSFNADFLDSVAGYFKAYGEISPRQRASLESIAYKWNVIEKYG